MKAGKGEKKYIDIHIGKRLRLGRLLCGVTQQELAEKLGLSYHQVQKYEYGVNRVSASTLFTISNILNLPFDYFFDGLYRPETCDPDLELTPEKIKLLKIFEDLSGEQKSEFLRFIHNFSGNS